MRLSLVNKNILLISPEPWNHIHVSKHHYAMQLASRNNNVFFLQPPEIEYHIKETEFKQVFQLDYPGFVRGLRFFPKFLRKSFINMVWDRLQEVANVQFDLVWSFDNSVFFDFDLLPAHVIKISHIVDLNQAFEFERAALSADLCIAVSSQIHKRLLRFNPRSIVITHGYSDKKSKIPYNLPGKKGIRAIYVGNLAMPYLDWEAIYLGIMANPNVFFIFIGPGAEVLNPSQNKTHGYKEKILDMGNCYFIGSIASEAILGHLSQSDLLLIAYQQPFHDEQSNPHKVMEYLASGKPIVSTFMSEYVGTEDLVYMSIDNNSWPDLLSETILNLDQVSSNEKCQLRIDYAMNNTYEKQVFRIEKAINELL